MTTENNLIFNFMMDLRKKELNPLERARVIAQYMSDKKLSQRALGIKIGVPYSTIQDWLMWEKITEEDYKNFKKQGLGDEDVYRLLRSNKTKTKETFTGTSKIDLELKEFHKTIKQYIYSPLYGTHTEQHIRDLVNDLNRIMMKIEISRKNGSR